MHNVMIAKLLPAVLTSNAVVKLGAAYPHVSLHFSKNNFQNHNKVSGPTTGE